MAHLFRKPGKKAWWACYYVGDQRVARKKLRKSSVEHRLLIGTPQDMSPEQAEGSLDIDSRTDVYSLGAAL